MAREQMMLFEMARQEQMNSLMNHQKENNTNMVPNVVSSNNGNGISNEEDIFKNENNNDEVDFDGN